MMDLAQLLPHCKRDSKLDTKTDRGVINEVADMKVTDPKKVLSICLMYHCAIMYHACCAAGLQQRLVF